MQEIQQSIGAQLVCRNSEDNKWIVSLTLIEAWICSRTPKIDPSGWQRRKTEEMNSSIAETEGSTPVPQEVLWFSEVSVQEGTEAECDSEARDGLLTG